MSLVNLCTTSLRAETAGIASVAGGNLCLNVNTIYGGSGLVLGGVLQNLRVAIPMRTSAEPYELTNLIWAGADGNSCPRGGYC